MTLKRKTLENTVGKGENSGNQQHLLLFPQKPAPIAHLVRAFDLKTRGSGFDSRAGQPNN